MKVAAIAFAAILSFLVNSHAQACCTSDVRASESEIATLTMQAKGGDQAAMWLLYRHYSLTPDAWNHAYWGERLARLNDERVLLDLASFYSSLGTPYLCDRAAALATQQASLSADLAGREAALKIAKSYRGGKPSLGKCNVD